MNKNTKVHSNDLKCDPYAFYILLHKTRVIKVTNYGYKMAVVFSRRRSSITK
jgi:hypothetical protein